MHAPPSLAGTGEPTVGRFADCGSSCKGHCCCHGESMQSPATCASFSRVGPLDLLVQFLLALHLPQLGGQAVGCILTPDNRWRGFGHLG